MSSSRIRVLIVEDSAVVRGLLEHIIGLDSRLEVAGTAESGEEALEILSRFTPDVIAMDIGLPGIDGLETTRRIMSQLPVPVVVVSGGAAWKEPGSGVAEALQAGALAVLEKPPGVGAADYQILSERLCTQLVIMSEVKLVRQFAHRRRPHTAPALAAGPYSMVGIVCSTGGPPALVKLLGGLGSDFPLPVLIVQHMSSGFLEGFAAWLESVCPFRVAIVGEGDGVATPGVVHLAPADRHLGVDRNGCLRLDGAAPPVCGQRPSGTVLFESMARNLGRNALGVLLTGMGQDGATGLAEIRRAGGHTIAQDEASSAVYGMPKAAIALGGACETLSLDAIAPRLLSLVSVTEAA